MRISLVVLVLGSIFLPPLTAQEAPDESRAVRIGPGVSPPRISYKVEPKYSPEARADHVQGTVVLQVIVDDKGFPAQMKIISPLGFGLDESALEAVGKWRFIPGVKEGKPVPVLATVEVNFRFPRTWFDAKAEERRTSFNLALNSLNSSNTAVKDRGVKTIQELASQKFPPGMYLTGIWELNGENVPKNPDDGWSLVLRAAEKNYGPALYEVAVRSLKTGGPPAETEKAWKTMRDAATLGSVEAQFFLGGAYEKGVGVPVEPDRARRYFRLCAAKGQPLCQYRLAQLLLESPDRTEDDYVQAIAWCQLAADQNLAEARTIVDREQVRLTPAQNGLVRAWKAQLGRQ
jgi:TonB family protein